MNRWFRFYDDVINDPKVIRLPDSAYRGWIGLLCVASKHKGVLPPIDHLSIYLRLKKPQVAALLAQLVAAGLIDKYEDGSFAPHNWAGRQFQSDGSAERVKRHREKRAAAGLQAQWTAPAALRQAVYERDKGKCVYCGATERLSLDHRVPEIRGGTHDIDNLATACLSCNGAKRDMTETEYRVSVTLLKRPHTTEQNTEPDVADAGDASARAGTIGKSAFDLAEQLLELAGHSRHAWPPGWCGAPLRVKTWLDQGWRPETIVAAVTAAAGRKHGAPANSIQFFEKAIAEEHARQAAPLPKVEIRESQPVTVIHGKAKPQSGGSLLSAIRRELASVETQIADLALPGDAVLSLPDRSVR